MLPTNQVDIFARLEGEIRGSGRNHCKAWTPQKLADFIQKLGGSINGNDVSVKADTLGVRNQRGGNEISGYKINQLFFVRADDTTNNNGIVSFPLDKVRQLRPCITAKMFFENLEHSQVLQHYKEDLQ